MAADEGELVARSNLRLEGRRRRGFEGALPAELLSAIDHGALAAARAERVEPDVAGEDRRPAG